MKDLFNDSGPQWAAAIAYYSLLSAFPLLLAVVSISTFFIDQEWAVEQITALVGDFLPEGEQQVESIIEEAIEARGTVSILSILALLWGGSRVFGVVARAMNIAFGTGETYSFFKRTLVELIMLLTIGLVFIFALAAPSLVTLFRDVMGLIPVNDALTLRVILQILPGILLFTAFFLTYKFIPKREVDWRAAASGSLLATFLFLIARPLFFTYVQNFADYHVVYGSLAAIVILIIWTWLVALILIFGAEVVAHIQMIMIEGQSPEEVEQRHKERSPAHKKEETVQARQEAGPTSERTAQPEQPRTYLPEGENRPVIPLIPFAGIAFLSLSMFLIRRFIKE